MSNPDPENPTRVRLVEAAILCFAEKGFDGAGIREIALKAQANSALVQYHFGGKTGLYAAALRHIFNSRPARVPSPPESADQPDARARAIQALGDMIQCMLNDLMACNEGSELEQASLNLVTRELQHPREAMAALILEHLRPYTDHVQACLRILRPDLDEPTAMDYSNSIFGQVMHLQQHLALSRLFRGDPGFPRDLQAVARHITEFSLRGIGVPEAFPGV
jgi:AcrR family transcriptional regulator